MFEHLTHLAQLGTGSLTWDRIMATFNTLNWRISKTRHPQLGAGRIAFAVLDRDRATGRQWVMVVLERATARKHRHIGGEMIFTLSGELCDHTDSGESTNQTPGMVMMHGPGSVHTPYAPVFWWGLYFQPTGNEEVVEE